MVAQLWRDVVMKAVLERFSPMALKILSDQRVQALLTQALNLQADMRQNMEAQVKLVARTLELATRDELASLRIVVKSLEAEIGRLQAELAKVRAEAPKPEPAKPAPAPKPEPATAPKPAPKPRAPKAAAEPAPERKKPGRPPKAKA